MGSIKDGPVIERPVLVTKDQKPKMKPKDTGPNQSGNVIKIGLIGTRGVGKSSILRRFITGSDIDMSKKIPTIGYDEVKIQLEINQEPFSISFFDMGGQKKYYTLQKNFFN